MNKKKGLLFFVFISLLLLSSCGILQVKKNVVKNAQDLEESFGLTYLHTIELEYAKEFKVDYFEEGYKLITIHDDELYLLEPENIGDECRIKDEQINNSNITLIKQPLTNTYMVASAAVDMLVSLDALDSIRFSALDENGWYIESVKEKIHSKEILYAGKYSTPDYELILSEGCGLAIENTMIYHSPEIKEELESFNIPVMVDYSSYEKSPMGRMEWIKLYGVLVDKEELAVSIFNQKVAAINEMQMTIDENRTDNTVAFFYISSNGTVSVRKTSDYVPKMIELAGGKYIFDELGEDEENASSSVNLQMEDFYAKVKNADYIIYNSTIEGQLESLEDFIALNPILENFKAVQENKVYCTTSNLYQSSMELGEVILDINAMLNGSEDMNFIYKLE